MKENLSKKKLSNSKHASSVTQKCASDQRNILSMFHQQRQRQAAEQSWLAASDTSTYFHEPVPSTSDTNGAVIVQPSLKRRCTGEAVVNQSHIQEGLSCLHSVVDDDSCVRVDKRDYSEDVVCTTTGRASACDVVLSPGGCTVSKDEDEDEDNRQSQIVQPSSPASHSEASSNSFEREPLKYGDVEKLKAQSGESTQSTDMDGEDHNGAENTPSDCKSLQDLSDVFQDDEDLEETTEQLDGENPNAKQDYRIPYYLENFLLIIDSVMKDEYYQSLFNDQDLFYITIFQSLSESCQMLFVRLIQRQHRWLITHKIQYPKIAKDLSSLLTELVCAGLLLDASSMTDLEDVLVALPAPDVKALAKTLKLNIASIQKDDLISTILQHSRHGGIGAFFGGKGTRNTTSDMIMKRAKQLLGPCFKLEPDVRSVFVRVMVLFGLHRTRGEEEDGFGGQQQVFQMLMNSIGRIKYPQYSISRACKIFKDRRSFMRFVAALQLENEMAEALETKNFKEADLLFKTAEKERMQLLEESGNIQYDKSLPDYLRAYTAGAVHTCILSLAVELLQYTRQYKEAVYLLEELIEQDIYHVECRGRWFDRLALNLDYHLKEPGKALDKISQALNDKYVRTGHRLSLYQRADKICHMACHKKSLLCRWKDYEADPYSNLQQAIKVNIQGQRLACGQQGPLYMSKDGDEVTLLTRVEDVALAHYKAEGYPEGIHGEGGTFTFLFGLYMWDVIFVDGIPDTFYNPYQICPLDWASDHFYKSRQHLIDQRLADICKADVKTLEEMLENSWLEHEDTLCIGVNWNRFTDVEQAKGFVRCLGGSVLSGILQRLAQNMRHVGGGLPDLVVWNPETKRFKMVEVKGPGDRLSTKQILWLDYLINLGVSAEVCHVQAVSSKKLKS